MGLWRDIFGPSKEEVWTEFAALVGAQYTPGGWLSDDRLEVKIGEWVVTLDTYTVSTGKSSTTYTRLRTPYRNPTGFRFKVFVENGLGWFRDLAGNPDIVVGIPEFDAAYVIQGNDSERLKRLFASEFVRQKLFADPQFWVEVRDDEGWFSGFPDGVDELYFEIHGVIRDLEQLKRFYEAFVEILHQLWWIDGATNDDPGVRLHNDGKGLK